MRKRNVLLTCGGLALLALGPFVSDPTEHIAVAHLRNDTHAPAELAMCHDPRCTTLAETEWRSHLSVGAEVEVNVSTEHILHTYRVVFEGDPVWRCVGMILDREPSELFVVQLSSARVCAEVN